MNQTSNRLRDFGLLMACNLIWASQFALVKLVQVEVGPVFATAFPMLLATLFLLPAVWPRLRARIFTKEPHRRIRMRDVLGFATLGIFGQVAAQLFVTWGVRDSLASNAALLQLALPVVTALLAGIFLRERMTVLRGVSFALALTGVLVCSVRDLRGLDLGASYLRGNLLILGGVIGSGFYNVYSKKLLDRYDPLEVLFGSYVFVCLVLQPLSIALEPGSFVTLLSLSGKAWLGLSLLAVLQYFLSMLIFLTVLSRVDATAAALSNYLIPFFGVLLAFLILDESLSATVIAGGALVLVSTLLATVFEQRLQRRPIPATTMEIRS